MSQNSPVPVTGKPLMSIAILFLFVFHLSPKTLNAQALGQLQGAVSGSEYAQFPAAGDATVYTVAAGFNVYFVSVGQGDAIYLELPNGQNALIDGGPSSSASGPLARFLTARNITNIDHVVLTHPHSDHYKGLQYVFANLSVANFYDTRIDNTGATGDNTLRDKISALGVNTAYPAAGDQLAWGGDVAVKVFNSCPQTQQSSKSPVINNCSITLKVAYQDSSLLFTGDIEADIEASLVARYGEELKADVLKVAHHGSQYSSSDAFLGAVRPQRAYIEVGKNNYGHPTQSALGRLLAAGISVFRTDQDGTQVYPPVAFAGMASANVSFAY